MAEFQSYRDMPFVKPQIKCKHITVGDYTYYSGYYHDKPFEEFVMYLDAADNVFELGTIDQLIIGKFCSIATGVRFMMGGTQGHNYHWIAAYVLDPFDDDFDNYRTIQPKANRLKGDTVVGNDVWFGAESIIMPGVHIADGAVIATRAVVTHNIGPYEIWGGNPAKLIKKRFSDADIEKLLQIKWWDWDLATLKQNLDLLRSDNVQLLWEKFSGR